MPAAGGYAEPLPVAESKLNHGGILASWPAAVNKAPGE
jgi:hypothetical protein